jgi:uncharacterized damage-inducible protein DinB
MRDLQDAIRDNQAALRGFLEAAARVPAAAWNEPRAPGKWSPAQVANHVALGYEVSQGFIDGTRRQPSSPRWLRPLLGFMVRVTILRTGRFMKSRTFKALEPPPAAEPLETLRSRLQAASAAFERLAAAEVNAGRVTFDHPVFGTFSVADYMQFQAYHTRHHQPQLSPASQAP